MIPTEYYSAIKKPKILPPTTTWIVLEDFKQNVINHTQKDKYHVSHLCRNLNKTKIKNQINKKPQAHRW